MLSLSMEQSLRERARVLELHSDHAYSRIGVEKRNASCACNFKTEITENIYLLQILSSFLDFLNQESRSDTVFDCVPPSSYWWRMHLAFT